MLFCVCAKISYRSCINKWINLLKFNRVIKILILVTSILKIFLTNFVSGIYLAVFQWRDDEFAYNKHILYFITRSCLILLISRYLLPLLNKYYHSNYVKVKSGSMGNQDLYMNDLFIMKLIMMTLFNLHHSVNCIKSHLLELCHAYEWNKY